MPLDGTVIAALAQELRPVLLGNRIEKIYQPEPDELVISLRHQRSNIRLLLSAHNQYPRIHMTETIRNNPAQPPVFCMLLRKHLLGGRIFSLEQPNFERILVIQVQGTDELNQQTKKNLVIEMMGKHSNIILVDANTNTIIDSIKRIPLHISRKRQVLPGLPYEWPPSSKVSPISVTSTDIFFKLAYRFEQQTLRNLLLNTFNGFSPSVVSELIARASLDTEQRWIDLSIDEKHYLANAFFLLQKSLVDGDFKPQIYRHCQTGKYTDFSVIPFNHIQFVESLYSKSVSDLLESYYGRKDHSERLHQKSHNLRKTVTNKRNRLAHKLQNLHQDEQNALRAAQDKTKADLIMANIHLISSTQNEVQVINFFDETQPKINISLDSHKTASQNAQSFYKRYQKSKTALKEIARQKKITQGETEYLDQILLSLEQADSLQDLEMIREELVESHYLRNKPSRKKQKATLPESKPHTYTSSKGHVIQVGKNNLQNEMVTFKFGKKMDLWFHVKDLPGSHVLLSLNQQQPTSKEIIEAAILAAYYSKGRLSSRVPVDYTWCKYVKKQRNAKPGMVTYGNHQTVFVTPSEDKLQQIRQHSEVNENSL